MFKQIFANVRHKSPLVHTMLNLRKGRGPMQHNFNLTGEFAKEAE